MSENLSITGEESQGIGTIHKIGSGAFVVGLTLLIYNYFSSSELYLTVISYGLMILGSILFTYHNPKQFNLFSSYFKLINSVQKIGLLASLLGLTIIVLAWLEVPLEPVHLYFNVSFILLTVGIGIYSYGAYKNHPAGIKNNYVWNNSLSARGLLGWVIGILLTLFYIQLYMTKDSLAGLVHFFDPFSELLRGKPSDKWFVYGSFYTFVILFLGIKFMIKYRHNNYQLIRTVVVIFSQVVFAYFIPQIMEALNYDSATAVIDGKETYLGYYSANPVNTWPLNYEFFSSGHLKAYAQEAYQPVGMAYLFWGIAMFLIVTPVVTYYVGKRWYCSWFCGCGGLAETAGDSFRHLSNKTVKAWKIERWLIHSVMVFVLLMTVAILIPFFTGKEYTVGFLSMNKTAFFVITSIVLVGLLAGFIYLSKKFKHTYLKVAIVVLVVILLLFIISFFSGSSNAFFIKSTHLKKAYGFFIGTTFSGVIGVGFYPILGNRVWCRFGCPMAGYMGLFQRFKSKFRITTNGGQCISCGNCSTYCEQGIDVRAYAQKGENIVRASCVGCGICSAVCPRGVLKLENGPEEGRITDNPIQITKDGIRLNH